MKRKEYIAPMIEQIAAAAEHHLLNWSAEKGTGGGNTPQAKEDILDDEDGWTESHNLWEE